MAGPDAFEGRLPPGWEARPDRWPSDTYQVLDGEGRNIFQCKIDRQFPVEVHLGYAWWRHTFPDAPPAMYLRFARYPDWLPEHLWPGSKSLEDLGSLGG